MQDEITTVAYSPLGMLFVLLVGLALLIFLFATAARKLPSGMPMIGSNSIAISAACHPPMGGPNCSQRDRDEMVLRPLSWGAVPGSGKILDDDPGRLRGPHDAFHNLNIDRGDDDDDDSRDAVGHCCFSDGVLEAPQPGRFYA